MLKKCKPQNEGCPTIEEIPESKLGEILDFMEFLLVKERHKKKGKLDLEPGKDPIRSS